MKGLGIIGNMRDKAEKVNLVFRHKLKNKSSRIHGS